MKTKRKTTMGRERQARNRETRNLLRGFADAIGKTRDVESFRANFTNDIRETVGSMSALSGGIIEHEPTGRTTLTIELVLLDRKRAKQ